MNDPQLQPPGAGLPWLELLVSKRVLFPLFCRRTTWEKAESIFQAEGKKAMEIAQSFGPENQSRPVLIPRLPGMEDSSRNWSPAMVLEHLVIVGTQMREVIIALSHGQRPPGVASTATVKPSGGVQIAEFEVFLADFWPKLAARMGDPASPTTYAHPWFGQMNLQRWQRLQALHQGIHRRQLERMLCQAARK